MPLLTDVGMSVLCLSRIQPTAFLLTAFVFVAFSFCALVTDDGRFLALGGRFGMGIFCGFLTD
jgi:hypothetical protein